MRKIPIHNAYTYQVVLRENDIIYANNMFYHSSKIMNC